VNSQPTEPPIAQLIGWHIEHREDNDYADGGRSIWHWEQWVDADGVDRGEPTVDDMLAWLYANNIHVEMWSSRNEGERDIYCYLTPFGQVKECGEGEGPTLHAALSAAVRVVASTPRKDRPE
jgi:hypothetical protein